MPMHTRGCSPWFGAGSIPFKRDWWHMDNSTNMQSDLADRTNDGQDQST
jgi:hypothetical protein